ncbi:MAG: beta-lactamase family protein [Actinomycetota bacterium]|nr:beta-lactamase family protein [Actinomycetota bacterium]
MNSSTRAAEGNPDLTAFVAAESERLRVPGAAVGVLHGDLVHMAAHGVTDRLHPRPIDADTLFLIGSTTKTFTATTMMTLVQEGALSLDDRVIDHLPELELSDASARASVTVGQLFDHTAGWRGDIEADTGWGDDALSRALPEVAAHVPQIFAPGWTASYNNLSLILAGRLIERVAGTAYEALVRTRLLEPLGMTNTFFLPWEVATRPLAAGHVVTDDAPEPTYVWPMSRAMGPAGGAVSSLRDQLRYAAFHLDGTAPGTPPLRDDLRLGMQQSRVSLPAALSGVGVSWLLNDRDGLGLVSHGGNCSNLYVSSFVLAPAERFAVTVLTNSRGGSALGGRVLDWALEHYLGRGGAAAPAPLALTPELEREYVGRYDAGQWDQEITAVGGRLFTQMCLTDVPADTPEAVLAAFRQPPTELVITARDVVAPATAPQHSAGDFVRGPDGKVAFLRYGMRLARRRS